MKNPPIVSPQEWEAARLELLVKEKASTRWWNRHDNYDALSDPRWGEVLEAASALLGDAK
jgi:hypothetical protein